MQPLLKKTLLASGVVLSLAGLALAVKVLFFSTIQDGQWEVEVVGNHILGREEIASVVLHLLRSEQEGLTTAEIEETLLMNPRIAHVSVSTQPNNRIIVTVSERRTAYLRNSAAGLMEIAEDGTVLQENIEKSARHIPPSGMPLFYLTQESNATELTEKIRSDIISLWQKTSESHDFLWGRIGEIEIAPVANKQSTEDVQIIIYPVQVRSRITIKVPISDGFLSRLWAVFFYLEKNTGHRITSVEINERNAIVKELVPES